MARQTDQNMDHRTSQTAETVIGHQKTESAAPEHTPTPWRVDPRKSLRVVAGDDDSVASVGLQSSLGDQWEANAQLIVKAVNNHEALVNALTDALCELTACASQLAARGLKGHEGDSVSRAQAAARDALSRINAAR